MDTTTLLRTSVEKAIEKIDRCVSIYGNPTQAALFPYLAGIIDGEGTIRINKITPKKGWNPTYNLHMSCGMVCEEIPKLLQDTFGGSLGLERVAGKRSMFRWNMTGRLQIYTAIKVIQPYLIVKKNHAELAIEFAEGFISPRRNHHQWIADVQQLQWREDMYLAMRKLNVVGAGATTKRDGTREGEAIVWTCAKVQEGDPKRFPRHIQCGQ
jgi:hypothetical protein